MIYQVEFLAFRTTPKYGPTAISGDSFKVTRTIEAEFLSDSDIAARKADVERREGAFVTGWRVVSEQEAR